VEVAGARMPNRALQPCLQAGSPFTEAEAVAQAALVLVPWVGRAAPPAIGREGRVAQGAPFQQRVGQVPTL